jgi:hypothetical protein
MAITRARTSSVAQGPSTRKTVSGGNDIILPGSYDAIAVTTVGSTPATEIVFSSIPQTYKHLQIRASVRNNRAATASNTYFRFNGDTASNYAFHAISGNGTSSNAIAGSGVNIALAADPSASFTANAFGVQIYDILDYTSTNKNKTIRILNGYDDNSTSGEMILWSNLWRGTSAISSIRFFPNSGEYVQHTTFALYGIK